ncbi:Dyp-type peroxidase [Amycolatopsis rubida]|uniref:Dyp-type peroxidase n=1 Tax=Amycolatopsis rubida TaxID=112413 RepID=A0ABX0BSY2_9PSEU|nr:Dyp-type peroxidase [Amycolatopsis sp. M39]MYW92514.1 Dyp-type peroxidase [Amycolatopsis rubida]NEC57500.1 Dyp-type peroxidase [Amycolatopsis rubida]
MNSAERRPSRRAVLGAAVTAGLAAGCHAAPAPDAENRPGPILSTGVHQAGIMTPQQPQSHLLVVVADVSVAPGPLLAGLGRRILAVTAEKDARLLGLPAGDLTVTAGVGPRLVQTADPHLPGAKDLPPAAREAIAPACRGGDLLLQICAGDPLLPPIVAAALLATRGVRERWRQSGARGPHIAVSDGQTAPRNVLGFVDGIVGPRAPVEQQRDLWLAGPAPVAGGTIAVVRRMVLDVARFAALPVAEQEAVFGRRRDTGVPLSGGVIGDGPELGAKTPDGRYLVPAGAHVRRAHANVVGAGLMLRRSYSMDAPAPGLLFVSFQNDLHTFTATLASMETADALLPFTTTTASGTFLVLPGFDEQRPLGSTLFPS